MIETKNNVRIRVCMQKHLRKWGLLLTSLLNNVNDGQIDERSIRTKGEREYN